MKKLFTFLAVIAFSFALSSCSGQKTQDAGDTSVKVNDEDQQEEVAEEEDSDIFASIEDAISKSIPLKCTFTDEEGLTMDMYIKGDMIRADSIKKSATDVAISEIIRGNKLYFWSEGSNQGMMRDFSKMQPDTGSATSINSQDDIISEVDKQKQNCVKTTVSDSIFELPAGMTFTEF